ncbi:F-box/kelch-repeat protein At3g23880-like [Apium graveolens]|uniref:F-box/kelch-repeat protein At3g23880-like n=1 Tax=Apium graveolens TaxID=4045 RepID=UPI003D79891E
MDTDQEIQFLHQDIIFIVLLLLPVEDLLRSKLVCKSWLSIISSPRFIKAHISKSLNDPQFTHHRFLVSYWTSIVSDVEFKSCSLNLLLNGSVSEIDHVMETVKIDYPAEIDSVVGSCNGLICLLGSDNYLFFWNPSTRKIRRLPKIDIPHSVQTHGFCYDESNDEFKVFYLSSTNWKHKISVYSSKTDAWRFCGDFIDAALIYGGYLVNGVLHWVVYPAFNITIQSPLHIVSLDIKRETYREVMLPNSGEGTDNWEIGTLADSLYALSNWYDDARTDLWVMRESDAEVSWIKLFTISDMDRPTWSLCIKPICITVNGDIMLLSDSKIVLYNPKANNPKDHTFKNLTNITWESLKLHTYVKSLISP